MKKRFLAALIALCMVLVMLPGTALAADSDFTIENGVLTAYTGSGGDVVIPNGVTAIGNFAFSFCTDLTSVTIPSSVTSIGVCAFAECMGLTNVTIPSSVTSIGSRAFDGCMNLSAISVAPGNSTYVSVEGVLFSKDMNSLICCPGGKLGGFSIPAGVTSIEDYAFNCCYGLTSLDIPSSVTSIGNYAFELCGLTSVMIPSSVTSIGEQAFCSCDSLTSVTILSSVTSIGDWAFAFCFNLSRVTIPSSVTRIGDLAFCGCKITDVYYGGSQAGWNAIDISFGNESLFSATVHYNSAAPIAYATTYSILVDGKTVAFDAYALRDENGNDTNYLKLRDVAYVLNGSAAQFNVGWDASTGAISLATRTAYTTPNGSEMSTPFSGNQLYRVSGSAILVNGVKADLSAITLTDANGGDYTYFKLRDLGKYLGFDVDWDDDIRAIIIDTTRPYSE